MKLYNIFPLLVGKLGEWKPHLVRASDMGFDWIFVNPIQKPGRSGSLYSIADYFAINPAFVDQRAEASPEEQMREVAETARGLGLGMMVDLVINHCAADSALAKEHPEWFITDRKGKITHPFCMRDGQKVVWRDLVQFDYERSRDREGLFKYCCDVVDYLVGLGFQGFRCDAAYQIPSQVWKRLIERTKSMHPEVVFAAETLGCSPEQTKDTAQSGFDYIFNSSKWWDFKSPWLLEQYLLTREFSPSISFPESHDTERLFAESHQNLDAMKQRYLFAALFSTGVMMPIGFEFGFQKNLHVVKTRPSDWEETGVDLTAFIKQVNEIKNRHQVFHEESVTDVLESSNPQVMVMWKCSHRCKGEALIILNKDVSNRQIYRTDDLYQHIQARTPLVDVSLEWPMDYLPTPFEFELAPGMARVLVTE